MVDEEKEVVEVMEEMKSCCSRSISQQLYPDVLDIICRLIRGTM